MEAFHGRTANDVWRRAHAAVMSPRAGQSVQPSRAGDTRELLHVALEVEDPRQRWVTSRHPAINPAFALAEVLWMLVGSNDASFLNYWFPGLPEFSGKGPTYAGAYGHRLRRHFGVDQLQRACDALSSDPTSRQVVLQLWDVNADLPNADGTSRAPDIPCNVVSLLKVRSGRLEWTQIMRSTDLHRGLPYNLLQFTVLQEVVAGCLGIEVGGYHHWCDSLHAYVDAMQQFSCGEPLAEKENTDSLALGLREAGLVLDEIFSRAHALTSQEVTAGRLEQLAAMPEAPSGYQNWLRILAAESARRRQRHDQAEEVMARCTNPQLSDVWSAWGQRVGGQPTGRPAQERTVVE